MRKSFISLSHYRNCLITIFILVFAVFCQVDCTFAGGKGGGAVSVKGYTKSNGTYVAPHYRSAPDGNFNNNWSTKGNVNPYTGKEGTKVTPPDNYKGSSSNSDSSVSSVYPGNAGDGLESQKNSVSAPESQRNNLKESGSHNADIKQIIIPANAKLNYSGHGWDCNRGFAKRGDSCEAVNIPADAKLNYSGHGWDCNRGFAKRGESCEAVNIPTDAKLNYSGHGWDCNRGFTKRGDSCEAVNIPADAKLNYSGHGWDCNRGFAKRSDSCEVVNIPANAKLNYSGHGWDCNRGFAKRGDSCLPLVSK